MKKLTIMQNKLITLLAVRNGCELDFGDAVTLMGLPKQALTNLINSTVAMGIVRFTGDALALQPSWIAAVREAERTGNVIKPEPIKKRKETPVQMEPVVVPAPKPVEKPQPIRSFADPDPSDICEIARALALGGNK